MSSTESFAIYPALRYRDARAMISWLQESLGFAAGAIMPKTGDTVDHAVLFLGDVGVMLGTIRDRAAVSGAGNGGVYVAMPESALDQHYAAAVAAGAEITIPLGDTDYGSREYSVRDPEGTDWSFGTYRPARAS